MKKCILVVDSDPHFVEFVKQALAPLAWEVVSSSNGLEALTLMDAMAAKPHGVLAAIDLPLIGGLELVQRVKDRAPEVPSILFYDGNRDLVEHTAPMVLSKEISVRELHRLAASLESRRQPG